MVAANNDERRKHARVGFTTAIQILLDVDGKQINLQGSSKDLSLRGLFVNTDTKFPVLTKCLVKINLTGGANKIELLINAKVVREMENGMGIEFDSMDVDTYSHLKNIVYYNSVDKTS
ncbi:MAG: PilZ domain-containing protein [Pseudomonadota bacterium]